MSEIAQPNEIHKLTTAERHCLHQQMLREHAERKLDRREEHKRRRFYRSCPPCVLI